MSYSIFTVSSHTEYVIRESIVLFSNRFFHFFEIVWAPKIFDNFSNCKIWILRIVKFWKFVNFPNCKILKFVNFSNWIILKIWSFPKLVNYRNFGNWRFLEFFRLEIFCIPQIGKLTNFQNLFNLFNLENSRNLKNWQILELFTYFDIPHHP